MKISRILSGACMLLALALATVVTSGCGDMSSGASSSSTGGSGGY
jgi:hypothetical protein